MLELDRLLDHKGQALRHLSSLGLIESEDYKVIGIYLQGSQNYNLSHSGSDVDSRMIVVPTMKSLVLGSKLSFDITLSDGEKCSIKVYRDVIDQVFKGNVVACEIACTKYKVEFSDLFSRFVSKYLDDILTSKQQQMSSSILGMMNQKKASMLKGTVTTAPYVGRYGYDMKDVLHVIRLASLHSYLFDSKVPYSDALIMSGESVRGRHLSNLLCGLYSVPEVVLMVDDAIKVVEEERLRLALHNDQNRAMHLLDRATTDYLNWMLNNIGGNNGFC